MKKVSFFHTLDVSCELSCIFCLVSRHYNGNRSKNQVVRSDLHQAKSMQDYEYSEMIRRYEEELQEQLEIDERIAQELQEEEDRVAGDSSHQSVIDKDMLLAQKLQAKEKQRQLRRRIAKEKREVDRLRRVNGTSTIEIENPDERRAQRFPESNIEALAEGYVDLTDLCMKPPPGLTNEEMRAFQAEQDEELARFLQEQEAQRAVAKEKLTVIETQDHEIARALQEHERAKARRLREKARHKARQQIAVANGDAVSQATSQLSDDYMTVRETEDGEHMHLPPYSGSSPPQTQPNFHNIAMDLDPTYRQQKQDEEISDPSGLHFARLCRVSPVSSDADSPTATMRSNDPNFDQGAYLPVQGHRRNTEKKKKLKDNCKTQ